MRKMLSLSAVTILALVVVTGVALAQKPGAHVLTEPVCTIDNGTITCTGGAGAGLGNQAVIVSASAPAGCGTKPNSNNPPGHAQFTSEPIDPRAGRINFPTFTLSADCPPGLVSFIGTVVTYEVRTASGVLILSFTVTAS